MIRSSNGVKRRLHYVLAIALFVVAVGGMVLRGRDAVAALTWGWDDLVFPIASEHKHGRKVNYGVYDYQRTFSKASGLAVEHIFVSWLSDPNLINSSFQYARERNRWLMITIEPFAVGSRDRKLLLQDIVAGMYDSKIASICQPIGSLQSPIFIRWGHEMESSDARYPWAGAIADNYIAAYQHFAVRCRSDAPKTLLVWSPKGAPGLEKYYPGRTFVDLVGLSLYGLPAYDLDHFGKVRSFREAFTPKYDRIYGFDRPVVIAEMGVSGSPSYQARWMADFFRSAHNFPLVRTGVYFNGKDSPGAWPEKYGIPDWTIDPNTFE
jgi:cellulose synthase (UDP-forming)